MIFQDCICFKLGRTASKISKYYRNAISEFNLTHGQFFMLVAILEEDDMLPSRLADKTDLDRATTTGLLDRLERDGWIERRPDPNDRRALRIFQSKKAIEHKDDLLSLFRKTNQMFIDRFTKKEWEYFQSLLDRL